MTTHGPLQRKQQNNDLAPGTPRATILIVGGGYAGIMAANRVARRTTSDIRVVLVSGQDELVHRVRLHEMLAGTRTRRYALQDVLHRRVQRVREWVTRIDAGASACELASGRRLPYDQLILAIGSRVDDSVPGVREHGGALASPDAALAFADKLRELPSGATVAVLGGGLTSIEVACEIAAAHPQLRVQLVGHALAPSWPEPLRARAQRELSLLGVELRFGVQVCALADDAVVLEHGERLPVAAAVWAAGFRCPTLAADSGFAVDSLGRVHVDETLRVAGYPNVVVAGDVAAAPLACVGSGKVPMRMACATAMPMGAHAADVVVDQLRGKAPMRFRYRNTVQCVSIGRRRGMLVFIDQDDQPTGRILGGYWGARAKEMICRLVIGALRLERRVPGAFIWPGRGARTRVSSEREPPRLPETTTP